MVLESFKNPVSAVSKPWHMLFVGLVYATVAIFLSLWIFKQYASLVMVFLTVFACVPLIYNSLKQQEKVDMEAGSEKVIMKNHARVLEFLLFLFLGFVIAYSAAFVFLPSADVGGVFKSQIETIGAINSQLSGEQPINADVTSTDFFSQIFFNNIKVLLFCIFFSFFYGAGAIFILTWNASVIGAAMGIFMKNKMAEMLASLGALNAFNYFQVASLGILRYMIHGIPEIAAYFVGGMAGGIISVAMINHDLETNRFGVIMMDSLDLFVLAVFLLFFAGLLEVFVTPIFFY
tara:strand:- start:425 stop:1294 length:870 start_codon:yes stop_codon:yes gene_type:complete